MFSCFNFSLLLDDNEESSEASAAAIATETASFLNSMGLGLSLLSLFPTVRSLRHASRMFAIKYGKARIATQLVIDSGSWQPGSSNMVSENSTPGLSGPLVALIAIKLQ